MADPMVLNDLAGQAILEGRHEEAAKWLRMAAECEGMSQGARRVLHERAQEQDRLAWESRVKQAV